MMDEEKYVEEIVIKTPAHLTFEEGKLLFNLAKILPNDGVIVEIGSANGGSTILLAKGSENVKNCGIYAIDPHTSFAGQESTLLEFKKNIGEAGVDSRVIPIIKTSEEAVKTWNKPINILWIDGNHNYAWVKQDIIFWENYVVEGGIIAFHDSAESKNVWPLSGKIIARCAEVAKVVKEHIIDSGRFKNIMVTDSITYAQKEKMASELETRKYQSKQYMFYIKLLKSWFQIKAYYNMNKMRIKTIGARIIKVCKIVLANLRYFISNKEEKKKELR